MQLPVIQAQKQKINIIASGYSKNLTNRGYDWRVNYSFFRNFDFFIIIRKNQLNNIDWSQLPQSLVAVVNIDEILKSNHSSTDAYLVVFKFLFLTVPNQTSSSNSPDSQDVHLLYTIAIPDTDHTRHNIKIERIFMVDRRKVIDTAPCNDCKFIADRLTSKCTPFVDCQYLKKDTAEPMDNDTTIRKFKQLFGPLRDGMGAVGVHDVFEPFALTHLAIDGKLLEGAKATRSENALAGANTKRLDSLVCQSCSINYSCNTHVNKCNGPFLKSDFKATMQPWHLHVLTSNGKYLYYNKSLDREKLDLYVPEFSRSRYGISCFGYYHNGVSAVKPRIIKEQQFYSRFVILAQYRRSGNYYVEIAIPYEKWCKFIKEKPVTKFSQLETVPPKNVLNLAHNYCIHRLYPGAYKVFSVSKNDIVIYGTYGRMWSARDSLPYTKFSSNLDLSEFVKSSKFLKLHELGIVTPDRPLNVKLLKLILEQQASNKIDIAKVYSQLLSRANKISKTQLQHEIQTLCGNADNTISTTT